MRRWSFKYLKSLPILLTLLVAFTLNSPAHAQDPGSFYLDRAQISGAPDDPFMTWRPYGPDHARFTAALGVGYSLNPLKISTLTERSVADRLDNPFQHQVISYLHAGLQINKRIGFDVALPIALVNIGGADPTPDVGAGLARGTALYDSRVALRLMAVESDDKRFRWGGGGALILPTGDASPFSSDGETTSWIFTNFEYHFGKYMFVGMIGPHFRPQQGPARSALQVGNEIRMSAGLFMPFYDDRTQLGLEIWGQAGFHDVEIRDNSGNALDETVNAFGRWQNLPFEWLLQAKRNMGDNKTPDRWYIQAGAGTLLVPGYGAADLRVLGQIGSYIDLEDLEPEIKYEPKRSGDHTPLDEEPDRDHDGYPDAIDQCPDVKEDGKPPYPDDGCPDLDKDDDGILDDQDKCPNDPEDKDGIEDEDGCPEKDADKDGILDEEDKCPLEKGVKNEEDPARNGCPPARKRIVVTSSAVELLEPIQFEYNSATIMSASFPLLDEVVALMRERPDLRLGIYGHTDNQGSAAYNKALSGRRAASVVKYLTDKDISAKRLESEGFGMEKPIAGNDTESGRARNRRVEFKILK